MSKQDLEALTMSRVERLLSKVPTSTATRVLSYLQVKLASRQEAENEAKYLAHRAEMDAKHAAYGLAKGQLVGAEVLGIRNHDVPSN